MNFAGFLLESGVLRFGDFRLKSGAQSPYFLNFGNLCTGGELDALAGYFAELIQQRLPQVSVLVGPPYKGISMASVTALKLYQLGHNVSFLTFRKESKGHGEGGDFLGHSIAAEDRYLLLDDVMSSGQTKHEAIAIVTAERTRLGFAPPKFEAVLVGVDRQQKETAKLTAAQLFTQETDIPVLAVATMAEVAAQLENRIDPADWQRLRAYLRI